MTVLKSFSTSEQAYLLSSFLISQGIEANVVDENAFGGNALGATKNSVRLEVPEEQYDAAVRLAQDWK